MPLADIFNSIEKLSKKGSNWKKTTNDYYSDLMKSPTREKKIKIYDRIDNLYSLNLIDDPRRKSYYLAETKEFVVPLAKEINDDYLIKQLEQAIQSVKI